MKINTQFLFRVFEVTLVCIGFYEYVNFSLTNNEAAVERDHFNYAIKRVQICMLLKKWHP